MVMKRDLKGVILETYGDHSVLVLTPDGDMKKVKIRKGQIYQVGEEIRFYENVSIKWRGVAIQAFTAAAVLVLIVSSISALGDCIPNKPESGSKQKTVAINEIKGDETKENAVKTMPILQNPKETNIRENTAVALEESIMQEHEPKLDPDVRLDADPDVEPDVEKEKKQKHEEKRERDVKHDIQEEKDQKHEEKREETSEEKPEEKRGQDVKHDIQEERKQEYIAKRVEPIEKPRLIKPIININVGDLIKVSI